MSNYTFFLFLLHTNRIFLGQNKTKVPQSIVAETFNLEEQSCLTNKEFFVVQKHGYLILKDSHEKIYTPYIFKKNSASSNDSEDYKVLLVRLASIENNKATVLRQNPTSRIGDSLQNKGYIYSAPITTSEKLTQLLGKSDESLLILEEKEFVSEETTPIEDLNDSGNFEEDDELSKIEVEEKKSENDRVQEKKLEIETLENDKDTVQDEENKELDEGFCEELKSNMEPTKPEELNISAEGIQGNNGPSNPPTKSPPSQKNGLRSSKVKKKLTQHKNSVFEAKKFVFLVLIIGSVLILMVLCFLLAYHFTNSTQSKKKDLRTTRISLGSMKSS